MTDDELLSVVEHLPETEEGLGLLMEAVAEAGAVGYLNHSSNSSNTITYFSALRHEVHNLLCTSSPRYSSERKQLDRTGVALVAFLAGTLTATFGAPAAIATPLAAVALFLPLKLGIRSWCKVFESSPNAVTPMEMAAAANRGQVGKRSK